MNTKEKSDSGLKVFTGLLGSKIKEWMARGESISNHLDILMIGQFTKPIFLEWLHQQEIGDECKYCALYYDRDEKIVSAFLMSGDKEYLYHNGNRRGVVFRAQTIHVEMYQLFRHENLVLIPLQ